MPVSLSSPDCTNAAPRKTWRGLALVTAVVLLAHWGLLHGLPLAVASFEGRDATVTPVIERPFTTRTIPLEAPATPPPVVRPPRPGSVQPLRSNTTDLQPNQALAPAEQPQTATNTIAETTPSLPPLNDQDIQLAASSTTNAAAARLPDAQALQNYAFPGSVRLKYDIKGEVKGFPYFAYGELLWLQDGATYDARLEISHFLLGSRVQTSKGKLSPQGLEPLRFGDKVRSEVAAHFDRNVGKVVFSANTPDAPLLPGAQDHLSVFVQLASMLGGDPNRFPAGTQIPFQAIGPRSSESWTFVVGDTDVQTLPGGSITAIKLVRAPAADYDPRVEVWLAPEMTYMPVRIRLTQGNGDFVEQQWSGTQKP